MVCKRALMRSQAHGLYAVFSSGRSFDQTNKQGRFMRITIRFGSLLRGLPTWRRGAVLAAMWLHLQAGLAAEPSAAPAPVVGPDAWVSSELMRHLLVIGQVPPAKPVAVRVPPTLRADLNTDAQVLCGRNYDGIWRVGLRDLVLHRAAIPQNGAVLRPKVAVSAQGLCATPATDTTLKALDADGQLRTTRIELPKGVTQFAWQDLFYHDASGNYVAVGSEAFAIIPARDLPPRVLAQAVTGTVAQGTIEDTHFSGFKCCAQLSPDGKSLYSVADIGDPDHSGYNAVVAVDTGTARYSKMYLPFSPIWFASRQHVSRFDKPLFELGSGDTVPLKLSAADGRLYTIGYDEAPDAETRVLTMRINAASGLVESVPQLKTGDFEDISASGLYWIARGQGDDALVIDAQSGKVVDTTASRVMAVGHAKAVLRQPTAAAAAVPTVPTGVLEPISARLGSLDVPAKVSPALASLARRVPSLRALRGALADVSFAGADAATHAKVPVDISELLSYFQRVPLPQAARPRPVLDQALAESQAAWAAHLKACEAFAQDQDGAQELAFLQCVLAPI
jgi:hypothetical protein